MQALTVNHIRILFCVIGTVILSLIAYLEYLAGATIIALFTLLLGTVLVINGAYIVLDKQEQAGHHVDALFLILLAAFSLFSADIKAEHSYWSYFFPIAAFFLFSLRTAILSVLAYTPIALYIFVEYSPALIQAQIIFSYAAISTISLFLAMVKSRTNQLLEPLISSDEETGAQLAKFLRPALHTEINRAEREGTGLLLVLIRHQTTHNKRDKSPALAKQCAQAIAQFLRPFDQYYRLHKNDFAIIMPHANSSGALTIAKQMITEMPQSIQAQMQVGIASLNVGDNEDSLIVQAQQALHHV
ncbi:MAG: GGDEF domain-containing protein [Oceanicoccus sp.]|jgi:GGDEF domain-containing protein